MCIICWNTKILSIQEKILKTPKNLKTLSNIHSTKFTLTTEEEQLFEAISQGNVAKATEILQTLFGLISKRSEIERSLNLENRMNEALTKRNKSDALQIYSEWFNQIECLPCLCYGTRPIDILSNGKYHDAIVKLLTEGNLTILNALEELGFNMFHKFSCNCRNMTAWEIFIEKNSQIEVFKKLHEYMETHSPNPIQKQIFYWLIVNSMIDAYTNNKFLRFSQLLNEFKNVVTVNVDFRRVKQLCYPYVFTSTFLPSFTFLSDAYGRNDTRMMRFLILKGADYSYIPIPTLKYINFNERKSLLMLSESLDLNRLYDRNSCVQKYLFNEYLMREIYSFFPAIPLKYQP